MGKADRDTSIMVGRRIRFARCLMDEKQNGFCGFDERYVRRYEAGKIPPQRFPELAMCLGISLPDLLDWDRDDDRFMEALAAAIEKKKGKKPPSGQMMDEALAVLDYGGQQKRAVRDRIRESCGTFEIIVPYTGSMDMHFRHTPLLLHVPRRELARRGREQEDVDPWSMDIRRWEEVAQERRSTVLIELLHSGKEVEQTRAATAVRAMGSAAARYSRYSEIMAGLAEMLRSEDDAERKRAASTVRAIGSAAAVCNGIIPALAEMLRSRDDSERESAASAIESMGRPAAEHHTVLAALLDILHSGKGKWSQSTKETIAALVSQGIRIFEPARGKYIVRGVSELTLETDAVRKGLLFA